VNETLPFPSLTDLLPHRDAMLLLDAVLAVDEKHAVTAAVVKASWPAAEAAGVASLLCVELIAQTIGVYNIWGLMRAHGENVKKNGWLVAVKRAVFHADTLPFGTELTIRAENSFSFHPFCEATGSVHWRDKLVAEVVAQIYQDEG